jgi:CHAD domain-containing protein
VEGPTTSPSSWVERSRDAEPATLLELPAAEGARRLALTHLETARASRGAVASAADPEALHDYRVALRRLRSCLRSYLPEVRSTVSRKSRRRLDRLARSTNRSRDLEVHLAWLGERAATAAVTERPGIAWLTVRLQEAQRRAREEMLTLDQRLFPSVHDRLRRQLLRYPAMVHLDRQPEPSTTADVTALHIERAARRLERRLRRIGGEADEPGIHRARIAAKHLRYLLEPFAAMLPGGGAVIARLKSLQDAYGDVHDAHVFLPQLHAMRRKAEHIRRGELVGGLRSLAESLQIRASAAFGSAAQEWLEAGPREPFFQEVSAARLELERAPIPV